MVEEKREHQASELQQQQRCTQGLISIQMALMAAVGLGLKRSPPQQPCTAGSSGSLLLW